MISVIIDGIPDIERKNADNWYHNKIFINYTWVI